MSTLQYKHTTTGSTLYITIRNPSNQYYDLVEGWETLVPASFEDYAIDGVETPAGGYVYVFTIPAGITAGLYDVEVHERVDSIALISDRVIADKSLNYDGTSEVLLSDIVADTNEIQAELADGGRTDLLVDAIKAKTDNLPAAPAATGDIPTADITAIKERTDNLPDDPADESNLTALIGTVDTVVDGIATIAANIPDSGAMNDLAAALADTAEMQAMFTNVDSTATDTITGGKCLEIMLAVLAGNTSFNTTTRVLTVYARDGVTVLWTVTISNTVAGTRTASTKV